MLDAHSSDGATLSLYTLGSGWFVNIVDTLVQLPRAQGWVTKLKCKLGRSKQNMCPDIFCFVYFSFYTHLWNVWIALKVSPASMHLPTYLPTYLCLALINNTLIYRNLVRITFKGISMIYTCGKFQKVWSHHHSTGQKIPNSLIFCRLKTEHDIMFAFKSSQRDPSA